MSDNEHIPDAFDHWVTQGLRDTPTVSPAFAEKVVMEMQRVQAEEALRKATRQERIAGWALRVAVIAGAGLLLCPPVWKAVYAAVGSVWTEFIKAIVDPARFNLSVAAMVVLGLGLVVRAAWNAVRSE
jgi:hypothetical protein